MKKYLLIPNLLFISLFSTSVVVFAQGASDKKLKTEIRYALSGTLTVYEKPDTTSRIIGQLIYNETVQVVVGSELVKTGTSWIQITSPYEGFYLQSKPLKVSEEDEIAVISREKPKEEKRPEEATKSEKPESDEGKEQLTTAVEESEPEKSEAAEKLFTSKATMRFGVGGSSYSVPEEEGYQTSGTPIDIYFEFLDPKSFFANIRIGLNSAAAQEEDESYKVSTLSLYLAYRATFDMLSSTDFKSFGFAGPAGMMSTLSGNADKSATRVGMMVGLGASYRLFWELRVGVQIVYFTNQQDFDVVKRYVGSTQGQLTLDYSF